MLELLEYCSTCLSSDRRLTPLVSLKPVLDSITWLQQLSAETDLVCWECRGALASVQRFQRRVLRARRALEEHRGAGGPALESLSTLATNTVTYADDYVLFEEVVKFETDDCVNYEYLDVSMAKDEENGAKKENNLISAMKQENGHTEEESVSDENEETKLRSRKTKKVSSKALDTVPRLIKQEKIIVDKQKSHVKSTSVEINVPKLDPSDNDEFVHLTKQEKKFIVTRMSLEEVQEMKDVKRRSKKFKSSRFKCDMCVRCYVSKEQYEAHMKKFHATKLGRRVCPVCSSRFPRETALRRHHEGHFKRYRCRQCCFSHHRLPTMVLHDTTEHGVKTYTCEFCGKTYPHLKRLSTHIEVMHQERETACKKCKKTFTTMHELKLHAKQVHYKGAPEECPQCGKMYRKLWNHLKLTHAAPPGERAYCAECGAQFRNVYTYRNHLKLHPRHRKPEALKYPCTHCDKRFTDNVSRDRHVAAIHVRDFAFKCDSCDKSFNRSDHLHAHVQQKHLGISRPKDKICTICGRGFTTRRILTHHVRTHTGEKPYVCERCGSAFAQKVALTSHVRNIHLKQGKVGGQ